MENRSRKTLSLQDVISLLKEEREVVSEEMRNHSLENNDHGRFVVLLKRKEAFNEIIKKFQDLIEPEGGSGVIGQDTLRKAAGPEPNRFRNS